ncbi:MAG: ion transporter [Deltaproteobacteria bacterium]|nr:MAG: ion transporter [Deltaproteobacteria bacterium]
MSEHARSSGAASPQQDPQPAISRREIIRRVIFEADTPAGKVFDVVLLVVIILSVILVMLESIATIEPDYGDWLRISEWIITGLFTVEYLVRLYCVPSPIRYARSFFGVVDLLSVLPSYLSLLLPGSQSLLVIRALRLLRIFRIFKVARYLTETNMLVTALRSSLPKVIVFMGTLLIGIIIMGSAMYLIEGEAGGFTSIPVSMYWAVVTMTTVGYGDIAPVTAPGKVVAAIAMLLGYSIIAVPTGIVSAELVRASRRPHNTRVCNDCFSEGHDEGARFCRDCGAELEVPEPVMPPVPKL